MVVNMASAPGWRAGPDGVSARPSALIPTKEMARDQTGVPVTITATFLEQDRQPASQTAELLAEFLHAARASLHLAVYDFRLADDTAVPVLAALRERAAAGVDVHIVYDAGKPHAKFPDARADPAPPGTAAFVKALGAGIPTHPISGGDPHQPKLMHHKYVVRDG